MSIRRIISLAIVLLAALAIVTTTSGLAMATPAHHGHSVEAVRCWEWVSPGVCA
jgi:hypothetical protein